MFVIFVFVTFWWCFCWLIILVDVFVIIVGVVFVVLWGLVVGFGGVVVGIMGMWFVTSD